MAKLVQASSFYEHAEERLTKANQAITNAMNTPEFLALRAEQDLASTAFALARNTLYSVLPRF